MDSLKSSRGIPEGVPQRALAAFCFNARHSERDPLFGTISIPEWFGPRDKWLDDHRTPQRRPGGPEAVFWDNPGGVGYFAMR
jgi:hypothetical protein